MLNDKQRIREALTKLDYILDDGKQQYLVSADGKTKKLIHNRTFYAVFDILKEHHRQDGNVYYVIKEE